MFDLTRPQSGRRHRRPEGRARGPPFLEDGDPGLEVRRLNVGDEPTRSAIASAPRFREYSSAAVAGEEICFSRLVEVVEGMEEFLLCPLFFRDELNVIDQQEVDVR